MHITQTFLLRVISEEGEVWKNQVRYIQSGNGEGPLSVLSGHANFISIITEPVTAEDHTGKTHTFPVENGIVRMRDNELELFLGVELLEIQQ